MIGPEVSTLEPVSRSHMTFPNLKGNMSRLPTMLMPIYTMIMQLEKLLLQFYTSYTKHQLMHTPKGNLQMKLQPMDLNLLLQGQQLTRSLTLHNLAISLSSHQRQELYVWGQQISCCQLYHPQLHHLQRISFGILSSSQGSNCS